MAYIPSISGMFQSSGWLSDAFNSIDSSMSSDGIMGALQNSSSSSMGSIKSALQNNAINSNALMTISSSTTQAMFDLVFKQAQEALDKLSLIHI